MPTVAELRAQAKALRLRGYSRLRKADLEQLIANRGQGPRRNHDEVPIANIPDDIAAPPIPAPRRLRQPPVPAPRRLPLQPPVPAPRRPRFLQVETALDGFVTKYRVGGRVGIDATTSSMK